MGFPDQHGGVYSCGIAGGETDVRVFLKSLSLALCLSSAALAQSGALVAPKTYGTWGVDLSARDLAVRPGDDFFRYASGAWYDKTPFPADMPMAGIQIDLFNQSQAELRALIQTSPHSSQLGSLYAAFMDQAHVDALDAKPLALDLARIADVSDKARLATLLGESYGRFGASLYAVGVQPDPRHPDMDVEGISQDGIGLPDRDYYLQPQFKPQLDAYRAYVQRVFAGLGAPDPAASAATVVDFEIAVAKVSWAAADRRDVARTNNPMSLAELQAYAPGFPWAPFLKAAGFDPTATLIIGETTAIKAIAELYADTPLSTLKAWETFRTVDDASPYLSDRFVQSQFQFTKTLTGVDALRPRWKRAVRLVGNSLGEQLGHAYVDKYFPPSAKAQTVELVANLKAAMAARIKHADWMGPSTKAQALAKLQKMRVLVGYPDHWRDYSGLKIDPADLYGDVERSRAFEYAYQSSYAGHPVDPLKWDMTPQTIDAYNGGFENKIVFPAGILQPPFFDPKADLAVNYGSAGAIIGHEISHGFDDQGRKIDATGALRDWWTAEDAKRFEAEASGFGKQYDAYEAAPGAHVNGSLTMGENIADMAGLAVALDAYHHALRGQAAPVLDGLTGDQRFFLAFAQSWRLKEREDFVRRQLASDPHSPAKYRVIGPVRNSDAWYAAFHVSPTATYYLPPNDRTRIW